GKRQGLGSCSLPCVLGPCNVLAPREEKHKSNSRRNGEKGRSWSGISKAVDFAHAREGPADMRNGDGAADDEGDIEGVDDLVAFPAFFAAAHQMVGDALVAAQHGAGHQAEKLLGLGAEWAGFVGLMVEREEALD